MAQPAICLAQPAIWWVGWWPSRLYAWPSRLYGGVVAHVIIVSPPVPTGLEFGFGTALGLGLGLRGPDLGLGLDNFSEITHRVGEQLNKCWVSDTQKPLLWKLAIFTSFFYLVTSCRGANLLYLLDAISLAEADVCVRDAVRELEPRPHQSSTHSLHDIRSVILGNIYPVYIPGVLIPRL